MGRIIAGPSGVPFGVQIALGRDPNRSFTWQFGFNPSIAAGAEETVWDEGGLYVYPSAAAAMTLSSSSALDTAAGTGARTVLVQGLDINLLPVDVTLPLNGQTGVVITPDLLRVNNVEVMTAGSGEENAGDIYVGTGAITAGVPADKFGKISIGENIALSSVCTIRADRTGLLTSLFVGVPKQANVNVRVVVRKLGKVFVTVDRFTLFQQAPFVPHDIPIPLIGGSDIEIRAQAAIGTAAVSGAYGTILSP